jgi:predicted protein tyrosine phosphatase
VNALAIWRASRTAQPNARIVSIGDRLLARDGRMVKASKRSGPAMWPWKAIRSGSISRDWLS